MRKLSLWALGSSAVTFRIMWLSVGDKGRDEGPFNTGCSCQQYRDRHFPKKEKGVSSLAADGPREEKVRMLGRRNSGSFSGER